MPHLAGLHNGTAHGGQPGFDRAGQRIAHRAGPVVKLRRTADENTARLHLTHHQPHPVVKHHPHPWQPARGGQSGVKHLLLKLVEILTHHRNLQLLARAKVRKYARLAHLRHLSHHANAQAFQPQVRRQPHGSVHNRSLGLLPLQHGAALCR